MTETESITDISDKSWNDLINADRSVVQELASERDDLDGRASSEDIVKGLLRLDGREDEIPEDRRDDAEDEDEEATEDAEAGESDEEAEDEPGDDEDAPEATEDAEDDTDDSEASESQTTVGSVSDAEPASEATFIVTARTLNGWVGHIQGLVDECKVRITDDGLTTRAVDPANVGMVDASIDADSFESFNIGGEGIIGLNIDRLGGVLKSADADQLVSIRYDADQRNLVLTYGGHEFTLSLIDPASIRKEPDLPDLDLPVGVEVESDDLDAAIKNVDKVTDHVRFGALPDDAVFEIHGEGDTDDYTWTGDDGDEVTFTLLPNEPTYSMFSMDYMKDIVGTFEKDRIITLDLGSEFPVRMHTPIRDGDTVTGDVTYMVAPRIQSD